jgi:hypothetical protein
LGGIDAYRRLHCGAGDELGELAASAGALSHAADLSKESVGTSTDPTADDASLEGVKFLPLPHSRFFAELDASRKPALLYAPVPLCAADRYEGWFLWIRVSITNDV